ncbi:MAG: YCF48-related protein [Bacteroidales bacterium]
MIFKNLRRDLSQNNMRSIFVGIFILNFTLSSFAQWALQSPLPTREKLRSLNFINDTTGFTVGDNGLILRCLDGGNFWKQSISNTNLNLYAVQFINTEIGYVSGENGLILKSIDGGSSWEQQISGVTNNLSALYALNPSTVYATGENGIIIKTTDGGDTWIEIYSMTGNWFYAVHFRTTVQDLWLAVVV